MQTYYYMSFQSRPLRSRKLSIHVDLLPVDLDVPAGAEVYDHVPVQAGLVLVAGFRVAGTQGEVDGAADLFVEERVLRVAPDLEVGADGALAEFAAAGIHFQHRRQKFQPLARR